MREVVYYDVSPYAATSAQIQQNFENNNNNNNKYNFIISGKSPDGRLVEMIELSNHIFFIGVQFHPEFKSRPNKAHPLFASFIEVAYNKAKQSGRDLLQNV